MMVVIILTAFLKTVISCPSDSCFCRGKTTVDCSFRGFEDIPQFRGEKIRYSVMDLSRNHLSFIGPNSFENVDAKTVNFSRNRLINVSPRAFNGPIRNSLQTLNLRYNPLSILHWAVFRRMSKLNRILLDHNNFFTIPVGLFDDNHGLEELSLAHNRISLLKTDSFRGLVSLSILNFKDNRLKEILDNTFLHLAKLHTLDLSGNHLSVLKPGK
ncbi:unnamed protein product [Dimorphilus gyrociliatus]|uniref:Uncharacterized protein n=1 Tax=Dimorphilus gyrociliatus TaxID=2664684 RepID=A0A7I8W248_9ANNE|nr:unnamed protein product [Dimorphilus gyrociliatus]